MRSVARILVFSFTLITSPIFASGGQSFYPFAFINPADLSPVKHWIDI